MCKVTTNKKCDEAFEIAESLQKEIKLVFKVLEEEDEAKDVRKAKQRTSRSYGSKDGNTSRASKGNSN